MTQPMIGHVTRGEFDLLRQMVQQNASRVETIDNLGTRGVGTIQSQLSDLTKDLLELKTDMNMRFSDHDKLHKSEKRERVNSRRWLIGTALLMITALGGLYPFLYTILHTR